MRSHNERQLEKFIKLRHAVKDTTRSRVRCPLKRFRFAAYYSAIATCVCTRTRQANDSALSRRASRITFCITKGLAVLLLYFINSIKP